MVVTLCRCVVVVCVLELLSATSSWAKATKTERQERHDESLPLRRESVMSALHSVAQAQLGPACRSDHKQDQHLAASVCVWNAAGRKKKVLKHAKIKHAETRRKKKHAGRYTCCRASSFAASSVARSGPLNVLPSFLRRARQPLAFSTAMASRNKCK